MGKILETISLEGKTNPLPSIRRCEYSPMCIQYKKYFCDLRFDQCLRRKKYQGGSK